MMRLREVATGQWTVLAICDERGVCRVGVFLEYLEADSRADFDQTMALLQRTAASGPPRSERRSRPLDDQIYELKTRRGVRLPYFYEEGRVIICTEALRKPKKRELLAVIERARAQRTRYFEEKRRGAVVIIREDS